MNERHRRVQADAYVYSVWHYCAEFDEPLDYSSDKEDGQHPHCVGIFSTRERAEDAIEQCRNKPGFRDWPRSFKIGRWELGYFGWEDGFVGYWEEDDE